jgi:hypothetical protein
MHKLLFVALSAATLWGAALLPDRADAMSLGGAAVRSAQDQLGLTEQVARVCRQVCNDFGICRTRCFIERDEPRLLLRDRDRDFDRDRDRFRERDRRDCSHVGPVVVCN